MITLGTGTVFVGGKRETFTYYKTGSAQNHNTSDDETLRSALQQALNADAARKEFQPGGCVRMKINDGKGYVVYKTNIDGVPNTAAIIHYHWNYTLDLPLTET